MNILIITNLFPPNTKGGAEILIGHLVDELRNDHSVTILTSESDQNFPNHILPRLKLWGGSYEQHKITTRNRFIYVGYYNYRVTRNTIRAINPDVILISQLRNVSYSPLIAALRTHPVAVFIHDMYSLPLTPKRSGPRALLQKYYDAIRYMPSSLTIQYAISNSQASIQGQPASVTVNHFDIVGVGIPIPKSLSRLLENRRRLRLSECRLGYLGRITREKGIHDAIHAVNILVHQQGRTEISLDIAGLVWNKDYLNELKRQVVDYNLSNHVNFIGPLFEDNKYRFLCDIDVLLFTSNWEEGHGMTYLESMMSHTPCICSAKGGAAEVLIDEHNCLIFEAGNAEQLAIAVDRMIEDSDLRQRIVENAAVMVNERFSIKDFAMRCERSLIKAIDHFA